MRTHRTEGLCARAAPLVGRVLRWGAALAVAAPLVAGGAAGPTGIANSAHDLSANSSATVRAVSETNTCKFCHTPHGAQSPRLLWNHADTAQATFHYGVDEVGDPKTTTGAGTPLPTTVRPATRRCLGCHDGSISVGDVTAGDDIQMAAFAGRVGADGRLQAPGMVVGAGGDLSGEHPVGIPYAGQTGYNGSSSSATVDDAVRGGFFSVRIGGCSTPSGICTSASSEINLVPNVDGATTNIGMECTTCHEPHNRMGFEKMLRVDPAFDGLCKACHNK